MDVSYIIVAVVLIVVIVGLYFIIKRNYKDQKSLEHEINMSELEPEKHDNDDSANVN